MCIVIHVGPYSADFNSAVELFVETRKRVNDSLRVTVTILHNLKTRPRCERRIHYACYGTV